MSWKSELDELCGNLLNMIGVIWLLFRSMLVGIVITAVILSAFGAVAVYAYGVGLEYVVAVVVVLGSGGGLYFFAWRHRGA